MLLFGVIAAVTLAGSVAALSLRNLVHCALALALALSGLAIIYLQLGAQFVGFAQVLVYVGAVAILIVFAILLTRGAGEDEEGMDREAGGLVERAIEPASGLKNIGPAEGTKIASSQLQLADPQSASRGDQATIADPQTTITFGKDRIETSKWPEWTSWLSGLAVAGIVFALLATIILRSHALSLPANAVPTAPVRRIGEELMTNYVLPLEVLGLLLTAALIGAVIIALREPDPAK